MTRFKELKRIEQAIEHKNENELDWALGYCAMRIDVAGKVATMRKQEKYWRGVERKVRSAISEARGIGQ